MAATAAPTAWYYLHDGEVRGPVAARDLAVLLAHGGLPGTSLVWSAQLDDWRPAAACPDLLEAALRDDAPSAAPVFPAPAPAAAAAPAPFVVSGPQVRPWVRYWAKMVDVGVFGLVVGVGLFAFDTAAGTDLVALPAVVLNVALLVVYVPVEALLLASVGTTAGRALFRFRLRRADGGRLRYGEACVRAVGWCGGGLACGVPLVSLVTLLMARRRLRERGRTFWDEGPGHRVLHGTIGAGRWAAIVAVLVLLFALAVWERLP